MVRQLPKAYQQDLVAAVPQEAAFVDEPRHPSYAVREARDNPGILSYQDYYAYMIDAHHKI